jgi:hypothetical protein
MREISIGTGFTNLSFESSPDALDNQFGEPWAHCVVSAINRSDYDSSLSAKKMIKEWARKVANSVAKPDVIGPFATPTDEDQYRPTN